MRKISIQSGELTATANLKANETAEAIWNELPIEGQANTWGDEIYFSIPVAGEASRGRQGRGRDRGTWLLAPGKRLLHFLWQDACQPWD